MSALRSILRNVGAGAVGGMVVGAMVPLLLPSSIAIMVYGKTRAPGRQDSSLALVSLGLTIVGGVILAGTVMVGAPMIGLSLGLSIPILYFGTWAVFGGALCGFLSPIN